MKMFSNITFNLQCLRISSDLIMLSSDLGLLRGRRSSDHLGSTLAATCPVILLVICLGHYMESCDLW